jgi:hypothetical protein
MERIVGFMPWKCPACGTSIDGDADVPQRGTIYRCSVCRLDLMPDPATNRLQLALPGADEAPSRSTR